MKKKINLPKLVLNKITIAHLSIDQQQAVAGGKRFSDPLTENPCDPPASILYCSRRSFCC
ncbi:hypothetical protein CLV51_106135 [Chitinophaga niastensis]|uniref:Uncharacterized protein n=1 Tax=Chitinophaga niastensis TaxID=536980 RepID=A0A2P8HDF6_CHINA|nr:hypothetical protein CLV51_106135 [Chitinophaga niastensis]